MYKKINYLLLCILFCSCAQVTSLNLQKHQFGQVPTKIVWIQVAGLEEEHLATLKFDSKKSNNTLGFEKFLCIGKSWEYNLFDIRPTAFSSFMGQITGEKNIKNSCEDYKLKPLWSYVLPKGYRVGAFEGPMTKKESLLASKQCKKESKKFLDGVTLWKMSKAKNKKSNYFHLNEGTNFKAEEVYYDKSCSTGECYSTFSQNIKSVFSKFSKKSEKFIFVVRDFDYNRMLQSNNYKGYKDSLIELEKTVNYFLEQSRKNKNMLVLLTTASSKSVEFPRSGKRWQSFEANGSNLKLRKSKLINTVFASGARAENFCGIYNQNQIVKRIFSGSKQQGLELAIINPFE